MPPQFDHIVAQKFLESSDVVVQSCIVVGCLECSRPGSYCSRLILINAIDSLLCRNKQFHRLLTLVEALVSGGTSVGIQATIEATLVVA